MRKLNVSVVIGLLVALIGAGLVFAYGHHASSNASDAKHPVPVLVADESLTAGTPASDVASHVHVAQIPASYVVSGAVPAVSSLTSESATDAVLANSISKGGQLSYSDFAAAATAGHVQPAAGHVALSIETSLSSGVARYLAPGQMVDVFVTYTGGSGGQVAQRTKLFASGVRVLSVSVAQPNSNGTPSDQSSTPSGSVVALLDLSPRLAEKVVNATTLGSIYLAYTNGHHDKTPSGATPENVITSNR